ncbi:hypothetical protein AXF21_03495 [Eubacterium minutum ATCC 700079]|nr:hypothetical protein AXF21_03495 [Eubacterium minutum ATCC 700079]
MGVEKITSKILGEAESTAKDMLRESEATCRELLEDAETRAQEMIRTAEKESDAERRKIVKRSVSVAEIDGRKILLEAKQKLIGDCFDRAVEKIVGMDTERYIGFLAGIVRSSGNVTGEIVMNEKDSDRLGKRLAEKLNKEISGGKFVLSEEKAKIKGGLLLKNGPVYTNGSIETLVEERYDELSSEVAAILFDD